MKSEKLHYQIVYLQLQKLLLKTIYDWNTTLEQKKQAKQWIKEVGETYKKTIKKFE